MHSRVLDKIFLTLSSISYILKLLIFLIKEATEMDNMIEIRWHGRGGQGAKTASLLLADLCF